jgi:hypothetical protein
MRLVLIIAGKNSNIFNVYFRVKMVDLAFLDYQVCLFFLVIYILLIRQFFFLGEPGVKGRSEKKFILSSIHFI